MGRKKYTHKPTREQQAKEAERYLLMGYGKGETAAILGVSDTTLRNWKKEGLFTDPTDEEIAAYKAELGDETSDEAADKLLSEKAEAEAKANKGKKGKNIPFESPMILTTHVKAAMKEAEQKGTFDSRVREDFNELYTRLALTLKAIAQAKDVASFDPNALLNWVRLVDTLADRVRKIDAESGTQEEPEDAVEARLELQRRREKLAKQYDAASGGEDFGAN